jgi:hypothetical protein
MPGVHGTALLAYVLTSIASVSTAEARIPIGAPLQEKGFERIAHRGGVTVFKHKHSDTIRLAADARFKASVDEVRRALLDYEGQVGTIDRLSEARVLGRSGRSLLVYQRLNLPWISDRDFNLKVVWWRQGGTTWIAYRALSRGGVPETDAVRVKRHTGSWQLKPVNGGRETQVRFQVEIDLGGWLPMWLARAGSGKEVPGLFASIDSMIQRSRYRSQR